MSNNIFLFTGEEPYLLHAELQKWKTAFVEKHNEQGLFTFTSDNLPMDQIQAALMGGGMFSSKSLIILPGIPKDTITTNKAKATDANAVEEFLLSNFETISQDAVVVLVSYKPDKRTKMYKFLTKNAQVKEFKPLTGTELTQFVNKQLGTLASPSASSTIIDLVGTNLYNLSNECDKLKSYCEYNKITSLNTKVIEEVVYQQSETNSFVILDNLFTNPTKTVQLIDKVQHEQQDIFQFLGMMYWGLKLVLQMVDLHKQGITSSKAMASQLKAHPFAVSKQLKKIDQLKKNEGQISDLYSRLLALDANIKTGKVPMESFWLEIKSAVYDMAG